MLFDFESHTSITTIHKSIDFLRDEGENKQNMLIFVLGCSTPLKKIKREEKLSKRNYFRTSTT